MPKLINLLNKNKMTIIVNVPENTTELAEAAIDGGADALLLHIQKEEFTQQKKELASIVKNTDLPVGIAAGWEEHLGKKRMNEILALGFDFFNIGLEYLSPTVMAVDTTSKILSLNSRFTLDEVVELSKSKFEAMDAAIIPSSGMGKELIIGDLQNYISIVLSAGIPVIVPTQRSIRPSEVAIVADTGARGMILTPVVTGTSVKHVKQNTQEFRVAVDDLG